jgi:hypothetical protein
MKDTRYEIEYRAKYVVDTYLKQLYSSNDAWNAMKSMLQVHYFISKSRDKSQILVVILITTNASRLSIRGITDPHDGAWGAAANEVAGMAGWRKGETLQSMLATISMNVRKWSTYWHLHRAAKM